MVVRKVVVLALAVSVLRYGAMCESHNVGHEAWPRQCLNEASSNTCQRCDRRAEWCGEQIVGIW